MLALPLVACGKQPTAFEQVAGRWFLAASNADKPNCAAMDPIEFREKSVEIDGSLSKATFDREGERILVSLEGKGTLLAVSVKGEEMTVLSPNQCIFLREAAAKTAAFAGLKGTWTFKPDRPEGDKTHAQEQYRATITGETFEDVFKSERETTKTKFTFQRMERGYAVYTFTEGVSNDKPIVRDDAKGDKFSPAEIVFRLKPIDANALEIWAKSEKGAMDERLTFVRLQ